VWYSDSKLRSLSVCQESETGRYLSYDDPTMFEGVVLYMYGAHMRDVLQCCTPLDEYSEIFDSMISEFPGLARAKTDVLDTIKMMLRGKKFKIKRDPAPAFGQLMSVFCKQATEFYLVADQYCLEDLKGRLIPYIKAAISLSWNHSAILGVFELLLNNTQTKDELNVWALDQIKSRFFLLLKEKQFTQTCTRVDQLQLAKKLAQDGYMQPKNDKTLRYCHNMDSTQGIFCHRNVSTKSSKGSPMCTQCGQTSFIGPARTRMWPTEGTEEPEVKGPPRKKARTTI